MEPPRTGTIPAEGCRLRILGDEDAGVIVAASGSDVPDWTFIPRHVDHHAARAWIQRGAAARDRGDAIRFLVDVDGRAAGTVGAQHPIAGDRGVAETFYFILPGFRRRGLATAALQAVDRWLIASMSQLRRLELHVIVGNPGSQRVAEAAGYVREGIAANRIPAVNGFGPRDAIVLGKPVSPRVNGEMSAPVQA